MKLRALKCPCCDATLDVELDLDTFYCKYCGARIVLENQSKASYNAKVKIKEFEHRERMHSQDLAYERYKVDSKIKEKVSEHKWKFLTAAVPIFAFVVLWIILSLSLWDPFDKSEQEHHELIAKLEEIEHQAELDLKNGNFDSALLKANKLYLNDNWSSDVEEEWNIRRNNLITMINEAKFQSEINDPNNVFMPKDSSEFVGKSPTDVKAELESIGFTNIELIELTEESGLFKKAGCVEHINVGGKTEFTPEDYFAKDTRIVIYHYKNK